MTIAIYAFAVLVGWHAVYEGIIAPSLRLGLRYELFALRDQLRSLKVADDKGLSDEPFDILQSMLNNVVRLMPSLTIAFFVRASHAFDNDPALRALAERRWKLVDECGCAEAIGIRDRAVRVGARILMVNSGGWYVYLVPLAAVTVCFAKLFGFVKSAVSVPERAADQLMGLSPVPA